MRLRNSPGLSNRRTTRFGPMADSSVSNGPFAPFAAVIFSEHVAEPIFGVGEFAGGVAFAADETGKVAAGDAGYRAEAAKIGQRREQIDLLDNLSLYAIRCFR